MNPKLIRNNPKFELFINENYLIINNEDFPKDNSLIKIEDIIKVELEFNDNFIEKILTTLISFFSIPKNTVNLRISHSNGVKEILLTNCRIDRVENIVLKVNKKIKKQT